MGIGYVSHYGAAVNRNRSTVIQPINFYIKSNIRKACAENRGRLRFEEWGTNMKLSTRLILVACFAALGMAVLAGVAVFSLRDTMVDERKAGVDMLVRLAAKQVQRYVEMEKAGKLSRDDAQNAAKEAVRGLHDGDDYVFIRTGDKLLLTLVHPDARKEGKESDGGKQPDGTTVVDAYLRALGNGNRGVAFIYTKRPTGNEAVPKINVIERIPEWGWVVGSGVFIDDVNQVFWQRVLVFSVIGGVVLLLVIVLVVSLARGIYKSLGGEPSYAAHVAAVITAGDMSHEVGRDAPAGSLLAAMGEMQAGLRGMISQIQQGASTLEQASRALSGQMGQIDSAARRSSDATGAMAASIEEMAVSISHISDNAKSTEGSSQRSSELAATGEGQVRQAAGDLQAVASQVDNASKEIEELEARSREIGGIAKVIAEIADQTNLLALNAAIEAARAGEQGRGFAVVADEVRKLAERTGEATRQITEMIDGIQSDTASVVASMQAVAPQVAKGVETAAGAAETLHRINAEASNTLENVREVANSTSEQSIASDNIAANVENIARMSDEMAEAVGSANHTVQSLEDLAVQLRESVARFRV